MLRTIVERGRFIDYAWVVARMTGRETIVAARLNMQQFIERIAIWQPRGSLLLCTE